MSIDQLNKRDAEIRAHALRAIKSAKQQKFDARETRAAIQEALTARDNARGDLLRQFLRESNS